MMTYQKIKRKQKKNETSGREKNEKPRNRSKV